jgi:hypothetical protein
VKSSIEHGQVIDSDQPAQSRRDLLRTGGVAALAGVLGVFGISTATQARNGAAIRIGSRNNGTRPTTLDTNKGPSFFARVGGSGNQVALRGQSSAAKGIGVQGIASGKNGESVGVQGQAASEAGIAGQFVGADGGTAIEAVAGGKRGVAIRTKGKLQFGERSGSNELSGGAEFVIPVAGGLTDRSLVLATLQDHLPGVHVESASVLDAEEGLIVVRLNQAVPEPATVAWIVLD